MHNNLNLNLFSQREIYNDFNLNTNYSVKSRIANEAAKKPMEQFLDRISHLSDLAAIYVLKEGQDDEGEASSYGAVLGTPPINLNFAFCDSDGGFCDKFSLEQAPNADWLKDYLSSALSVENGKGVRIIEASFNNSSDLIALECEYIVGSSCYTLHTFYLTKYGKEDLCAPIFSIYNTTEKVAA